MSIFKVWNELHTVKKSVLLDIPSVGGIIELAETKGIFGKRIFLLDGTEIDDDSILNHFKNEVLVLKNDANESTSYDLASTCTDRYSPSQYLPPSSPCSSASGSCILLDPLKNSPVSGARGKHRARLPDESSSPSSELAIDLCIPVEKISNDVLLKLDASKSISGPELNELIRIVSYHILHNIRSPGRTVTKSMAQKLCSKFPILQDKDDEENIIGFGYYTIFKKIEDRVNYLQRSRTNKENTPSEKVKRLSKRKSLASGCKNWQPSTVLDDLETVQASRNWLRLESIKEVADRNIVEIDKLLKSTFSSQREYFNSRPPPTAQEIIDTWPILLEEQYLLQHFAKLCDISIDLEQYKQRYANILKYLKREEDISLELNNVTDGHIIDTVNAVIKYFKESSFIIFMEEGTTRSEVCMKVEYTEPTIVAVATLGGSNKTDNQTYLYYLLMEKYIITDCHDIVSAITLLMATYYTFNVIYNAAHVATLEFLQRYIFKINPVDGSKSTKAKKSKMQTVLIKVIGLINKLRHK